MIKRSVPIVLASLSLGLCFDWFFYGKIPGISVAIYACLVLGFTFYFTRLFRHTLSMAVYGLAPVLLFFATMVFVRANPFLAFMNVCLVIYLLLLVAHLAWRPELRLGQYKIGQYFSLMIVTPVRILAKFFEVGQKSLNHRSPAANKDSYLPILRGIIISLPILFIFLLLLSSADLVFKQYIDSLFDLNVSPEAIFRWCLIGFVASLFTGAYALIFMPSTMPEAETGTNKKRFDLGATESSIILGSVSALFFAFVIIQLTYLFGGSGHVTSTGLTYADYARKGFFELITVAAISLALILTIKASTQFRTLTQSMVFKWLSGILILEVLIIMLSAHTRLNLYEDAYGFTTLRLLSHLFILWLAVAFGIILFHIIREQTQKHLAFQLFVSVFCFFALINIINPDAFIARQNIERFNHTGKLDLSYLSNLSEDAVPEIAKLLDNPDKAIRTKAFEVLHSQNYAKENKASEWQSANLARQRAIQIVQDSTK